MVNNPCPEELMTAYKKAGPIVRIRHDTVVITTPEALRTIYDSRANVQKANSYRVWPKIAASPNTFSCVDKLKHARRRRILNAAISDRAIRSAEKYVIEHVDRWLTLLSDNKGEWSDPRNMSTWCDSLQFDIMAELCYGKSFATKEPGENALRSIPHDIAEFMWLNFRVS
jgi:cytochrome P450